MVDGKSMSRESLIRRTSARSKALLGLIALMFTLWTLWSTAVLPYLQPTVGFIHTAQSVAIRLVLWVFPAALYLWRYKPNAPWRGLGLGLPSSMDRGFGSLSLVVAAALAVSVDVARKLGTNIPQVWVELWARGNFEGFQTPFFEELVFRE